MNTSQSKINSFKDNIRKVTETQSNTFVALSEPRFRGRESEFVQKCIETNWVSSEGAYVKQFEKSLADFTGIPHAVAVVNGTAALHMALILAGVEQNDEVLTPALTFVATTNAIAYLKATPHFVDSSFETLGVCPIKLDDYLKQIVIIKNNEAFNKDTGRRIKALIVMHTFGHSVDLDSIQELCNKYCLVLIEDAAEALGTLYKGKHVGSHGKISILSFNGNKTITTGGGGTLLFSSEELARKAKHLTTTAKVPHAYEYVHDQLGYNYRMPNINAALGVAQMEYLDNILSRKRSLAQRYHDFFKNNELGEVFKEFFFSKSNYWLNCFILNREHAEYRNELIKSCIEDKIMIRPCWKLQNTLGMYTGAPHMDLSVAEDIEKRLINLPSSDFLFQE